MKKIFILPYIAILVRILSFENSYSQTNTFLGQTATVKAEIFAPQIISTDLYERDISISADGTEVYFSQILSRTEAKLMFRKFVNGKWSEGQVLPFSGKFYDIEPAVSSDGKKIYFASNRNLAQNATKKDFDIWVVERKADDTWTIPQNLGEPINTVENEFYPSLSKNGNLYFTAKYGENENIWVSKLEKGKYSKPEALSEAVNSEKDEFNAFVSEDEKLIVFSSYGRADDTGRGDLYISTKDEKGNWQTARNLKLINSAQIDYCPYISKDRKYFFFTREKQALQNGDIYWIKMSEILK